MGNGHRGLPHAQLLRESPCDAEKLQSGFATAFPHNFNIHEAHAVAPARAQCFHGRFLRGKTARVALEFCPVTFAVSDFARCEHTLQELLAIALNSTRNTVHFDDVNSQTDNHIRALKVPLGRSSGNFPPGWRALSLHCGLLGRRLVYGIEDRKMGKLRTPIIYLPVEWSMTREETQRLFPG